LSKVLRSVNDGPTIFIGERRRDSQREAEAEERLGELFPLVSIITDLDGAKLIPISEISKMQQTLRSNEEAAHAAGYDEGFARGKEEGLADARRIVAQFDQAVRDAVQQRQTLLDESRRHILDLVQRIARKVSYSAIKVNPEITLTVIDGVIDSLIDRSRIKIKVHPDHLPLVEQNTDRFLSGSTTIKELSVEADPRVKYGGCFIETPNGDIDARIESQLEVIESAMLSESDDE
jgi:flagellar assembly protein FliH